MIFLAETLVQIKEEKDKQLQEPRILEAMPGKSQTDKHRSAGVREKGDSSISGFEVASNNIPKSCKVSATDVNLGPEMKKRAYRPKTMRNKPNMLESKVRSNWHLAFRSSMLLYLDLGLINFVNKAYLLLIGTS